ncbi:MAG: sulfatase [Planctomycetes bacterium]|nr:sulfatase [Planctomycetota bacterium]
MAGVWGPIAEGTATERRPLARSEESDPMNDARPNILFIAIDDLNDWVGCLGGHSQAKTPHIDRLAARGTVFTNAHCQSPLCNPSRTSLMTGLRPTTTGVYGLAPWIRTVPEFQQVVTLPQYLMRHGYRTTLVGKIYHGGYPPAHARGGEFHEMGRPEPGKSRPERKFVHTPDDHPLMDWGVFPERDEDHPDAKTADWAVDRIGQGLPEPYFLAVGFALPHVPCYASQAWFDLHPDAELVMPPLLENDRVDIPDFAWYLHWRLPEPRLSWLRSNGQWRPLVRAYLATTSFVDSQVGRVLDALDASGQADRTIVVLWSDHGWHLGEKGISGKNTLWERSTRVPLVFAGPGVTQGARCARPAELLDLYPTLAELCGLPAPPNMEGHSLVPQLGDARAVRAWPAITSHNQGNHAIRSEHWRYIQYADGSEELYDLESDPNEWRNRVGEPGLRDVVAEHRRWIPKRDVPPAPGSAHRVLTYDPRTKEAIWEGKPIVLSEKEE